MNTLHFPSVLFVHGDWRPKINSAGGSKKTYWIEVSYNGGLISGKVSRAFVNKLKKLQKYEK